MSKVMTFSEAVARFGPLITTGSDVEDVVQEAFNRIYEMGRFSGTTRELSLVDSDFIEVDEEWFLFLDEEEYSGMIGFRNKNRGWQIMDQTILYRGGVNGGDLSIIDFGTVDVEEDGEYFPKRKYRMPLGFTLACGPYYALMKLEPPEIHSSTIIPIQSVGAFKCAILAVSYEMVSDDERANINWQKFNELMKLSERQVEGPKRYYVGFDSSLRRKPSQFM